MDPAVLYTAVDRAPVNDDGRSGAALERVLLADGSRVVVKRFDPSVDLLMRLSGDARGREVDFFRRDTLDRLPATVLHRVDHLVAVQREATGPAYDDAAPRRPHLVGLEQGARHRRAPRPGRA